LATAGANGVPVTDCALDAPFGGDDGCAFAARAGGALGIGALAGAEFGAPMIADGGALITTDRDGVNAPAGRALELEAAGGGSLATAAFADSVGETADFGAAGGALAVGAAGGALAEAAGAALPDGAAEGGDAGGGADGIAGGGLDTTGRGAVPATPGGARLEPLVLGTDSAASA
jgi:hypothetical protein